MEIYKIKNFYIATENGVPIAIVTPSKVLHLTVNVNESRVTEFLKSQEAYIKQKKSLNQILDKVCKTYKVSINDLTGKDRYAPLPEARKLAILLALTLGYGWQQAAVNVNRDHSNVSHTLKTSRRIKSLYNRYIDICNDWEILAIDLKRQKL
jgi:chromosomal replication initiation ATPase DnaA